MPWRPPDIEIVIARCFSFIGPHLPLDARFAAGNFIRDALAGGPIKIKGDGSPVRSYLYAADLVIWLLALLLHGKTGRAYNVGSDEIVSMSALAERIAAHSPVHVGIEVRGAATEVAPPAQYIPDISLARSELGLAVLLPLDHALTRTMNWVTANNTFA